MTAFLQTAVGAIVSEIVTVAVQELLVPLSDAVKVTVFEPILLQPKEFGETEREGAPQ